MKRIIILLFFAATFSGNALWAAHDHDQCRSKPNSSFIVEDFEQLESRFLHWEQQYQNAPMYSDEKNRARNRMDKTKTKAVNFLQRADMSAEILSYDLESFTLKLENKYNQAAMYSMKRDLYKESKNIAWQELKESLSGDLNCDIYTSLEAFDQAEAYETKYSQAPMYSQKRDMYKEIKDQAWQVGLDLLDRELLGFRGRFKLLEAMALDFNDKYTQAAMYSKPRDVYKSASEKTFTRTTEILSRRVYQMPMHRLERLAKEYQTKTSQAPMYSKLRDYYGKAKDIINDEIDRRF